MAHFAKIGLNDKVTEVIVVHNDELLDENNQESEQKGIDFLHQLYNDSSIVWKQTSYNGSMRKNFASIGFTYSSTMDKFVPPQPFISWVLNEETCIWEAPIAKPDGNFRLNECTQEWDAVSYVLDE